MKIRRTLIIAMAAILALALSGAGQQSADQLYKAGLYEEEVGGDLQKAIGIFQEILKRFPANPEVAAKAQLRIGFCYEKLGIKEAEKAFQKVIDNYPGEAQAVREARDGLARLRQSRPAGEKAARGATVRRIMYWDHRSIDGAISPDERYVSITDWQTGDLAVKDIITGKERRLTNKGVWDDAHPGYAFESVWSPDSQRLAYTWVNANNATELHEVGIADPRPRTVRGEEKGVWLALLEWSADGQSILAKGISGEADLRLISAAEGTTRIVKSFPGKDFPLGHASLSPDGTTIVYSRPASPEGQTSDIFLLTVADGREIPLVQHPAHDEFLSWLPDGGGILFASDRSGRFDAWVLPVEAGMPSGSPTMVKGTFGAVHPLLMTSEGRFYYSTPGAWRTIYSATLDPQTGRLVDPPAPEPLTYEGKNFWPAWSPDGKTLAYTSLYEMARRTGVLCLYRADTKELREIRTERRFGAPRWTADGRGLILQGLQVNGGGVYQLDLATEEVTPLVGEGELYAALVRPDRKMVVYGLGNSKEKINKVMVRDLVTGQDTELARTPLANNTAAFSPDGRRLAMLLRMEENLRVLTVMDLPAGTPKEILRFEQGGAFIISLAWSPDGRFVYFSQSAGDDRNWDLWRVPAEGGQAQDLRLRMQRFEGLSFHPDGRRITFGSVPSGDEFFPQIWVMENFLPPAPEAKKETGFQVRKVWDKADPYFMGAPSPDGKYLTYADDFMGLGVRDLVTGQNRLLLQNKSWDGAEYCYCYNSIFSPDGGRIAYICQVKDRLTQLRIVDRDGTSTRVLRNGQDRTDYVPFAWTSNGRSILTQFTSEGVSGIAFVSALDGSIESKKVLSFKIPWAEKMSLSPDGRYVAGAFTPSEESSAKDIFLLPIEGDDKAEILRHPADEAVIGWSPDGGRVLFRSDRTGAAGIWAVRVLDGKAQGEPELVRANLGSLLPLGLTRDGRLYYGISTGSSDVFIAAMDPSTVRIIGQPFKAVLKYETFNSSPDWSPDGQFLACHSTRGRGNASPALLIRSIRTDEIREVIPKTPGGRFAPFYLRWSPDGRSIIGVGRDEEGHVGALLSVDVRTGEGRILARADAQIDGKGNIIAPDWSPDGKSVIFVRIGNDFRRICSLDLETGVEREIYRFSKASGPFWLASSPDGRKLAFDSEGKLRILSLDGSAPRELGVGGGGMTLAWMPDGKTILFGKSQDGGQGMVELWSIPAAGGEPRKTGLAMSRLMVPRVSPDGRSIAFMASEQPSKSEVWVMENFLPDSKARK